MNEDSEKSDEYSTESEDFERILNYPDPYDLNDDEHWILISIIHRYTAAVGSFFFQTIENEINRKFINLITIS